jgi:predicted DNA-binding transcriptional regulator AlpA
MNQLSETGFLRLNQIIGKPKAGIPAIVPVSKTTWWAWVKEGRAPKPIKLSQGVTAWRAEDIYAFVNKV